MTFANKRILITGAGRGLGAAFAVVLADQGAEVILTGRNVENLNALAESIRLRTGRRPETHVLDMADLGQVTSFAKKLRDAATPLDILINNAAHWMPGKLHDHDSLDIANTITGIVTGTLLFTRGLIPLLEKSAAGDIMTIVSISGLANTPLTTASVAYYAAKHGQAAMSEGLRQELRGRPVRVHALSPAWIKDISPLNAVQWNAAQPQDGSASNRDIVEMALYMLSRPRHVKFHSVIFDPDQGAQT